MAIPINDRKPHSKRTLKNGIYRYAVHELGFEDCRFTDPFLGGTLDEYRDWISDDSVGDMGYLKRHLPFKEDPNLLLPGVKTAIVLMKNYKNTPEKALEGDYKVARYAMGKDYHRVIQDKLQALENYIKEQSPEIACYSGVDSRPIAERSLAIQAGIGFRGKNTMLLRPKWGSYFFLGVLFMTTELPSDAPLQGTCGTCTRCIDACPTQAITPEGTLLATQCISYKTIEQKEPVTEEELATFDGWLFGCDRCQEVCPFNHGGTPLTDWPAFTPEEGMTFNFLERFNPDTDKIPKTSPLYRSRKRVIENVHTQRRRLKSE